MGQEIDLLKNYPKTKRDTSQRSENKTEEDRFVARKFGKEFFDGDRKHGYGGFSYNSKFWEPVVPDFINFYGLDENSKVLDIGSGAGGDIKKYIIDRIKKRNVTLMFQESKETRGLLIDDLNTFYKYDKNSFNGILNFLKTDIFYGNKIIKLFIGNILIFKFMLYLINSIFL